MSLSIRIWLAGIAGVLGGAAIAWYYIAGAGDLAATDYALVGKLAAVAETLGTPGPGDWRYEIREPAQSLDDFVKQRWTRPSAGRRTIFLVPLDSQPGPRSPDPALLRSFVAAYFMLPDSVLPPLRLDERTHISRVNPSTRRKQFLTDGILDAVVAGMPSDAFCCAAFTMRDLYPEPSWEFVFGQSSLTRRAGVVSFARFLECQAAGVDSAGAGRAMLTRSCKVLAHEIGHMFGLFHCVYYRCCMNGSNNLAESDAKPMEPCPVCLAKLRYGIGFSIRRRFERLHDFYEGAGLADPMREIEARLKAAGG
jgi:archaemetzincin